MSDKKSLHASIGNTQSAPGPDRTLAHSALFRCPWPEWNDTEINAEKWEFPGLAKTSNLAAVGVKHPHVSTQFGFENLISQRIMPPCIPVCEWRRALEVHPTFTLLPEDINMADLDLISSNGHILHSEVMRHIVASITNLHHLALIKPFDELAGDNFVPNGGRFWKPWNHVYALCKVGKGTTHKPEINNHSKYVVRLYFLGRWRRITVDDYLPLDEFGRILLPMTSKQELWPILLSKAILQIAALTWTPQNEVLEMNAITCFTGWFVLNVECERVLPKDVWLVCQKALMNEAEDGGRYTEMVPKDDPYLLTPPVGDGDHRKLSMSLAACNSQEEGWGTMAVFAEMREVDSVEDEEMEEIGPCVGHQVLITEARVMRIGGEEVPLPMWKTFRWKKWALKMGIIQPDHLVNVKSLRLFAPFSKWTVPMQRSATTINNDMAAFRKMEEKRELELEQELEMAKLSKGKKRKGKGNGKEKGQGKDKRKGSSGRKRSGNSSKQSSKGGSTRSRGGSKGSKGGSKGSKGGSKGSKGGSKGSKGKAKKEKNSKLEIKKENTDPWMNFNVYTNYVTSLQLCFKTSSFKYCKSTSNVQTFLINPSKEAMEKGGKKEKSTKIEKSGKKEKGRKKEKGDKKEKRVKKEKGDKKERGSMKQTNPHDTASGHQAKSIPALKQKIFRPGEDFFLICDSPTNKKIFVTVELVPSYAIAKQDAILGQLAGECEGANDPHSLVFENNGQLLRPRPHQPQLELVTVGTTTRLLSLPEGQVILRIWFDLPKHYFVQFVSQSEFQIGNVELISTLASEPTASMTMYGKRICDAFSHVQECASGSPDHVQAVVAFHASYLPVSLDSYFMSTRHLRQFTASMRDACEQACSRLLYERLKDDIEKFYIALKELEVLLMAPGYALESLKEVSAKFYDQVMLRDNSIVTENSAEEVVSKKKEKKGKHKGKVTGKDKKEKKDKSTSGSKKGANKSKAKSKVGKVGKKSKSSKSSKTSKSSNSKKKPTPHILFEKPVSSGMEIVQKIVEIKPEALDFYPFRNDFRQQVVYSEISGTSPTNKGSDWFPLARLVVTLDEDQAAEAWNGVYSTSSAALCFLNVIDNDTQVESMKKMGNLCKAIFHRNTYGYTIFAYGYCEDLTIKEHSWKIRIVAEDSKQLLQCREWVDPLTDLCISAAPTALRVKHVYGHYIPNKQNTVLRCILTVSRSQVLTIRVKSSNPQAQISIHIVRDDTEEVKFEKEFVGRITLPSMPFLVEAAGNNGQNQSSVYLIDGVLTHSGSWTLTDAEQSMVAGLKERRQRELRMFAFSHLTVAESKSLPYGSIEHLKHLPSSQNIIPQAAYWSVEVVVDAALESTVELERNTRKEMELRRLKEAWEREEPGRHIRAMHERNKILEECRRREKETGVVFAKSPLYESFRIGRSTSSLYQRVSWEVIPEEYGIEQMEKRMVEREEYDKMLCERAEQTANMCVNQQETNKKLEKHMIDYQKGSIGELETGYKLRELSRANTVLKDKKGKGEKKGKKGGKSKKIK